MQVWKQAAGAGAVSALLVVAIYAALARVPDAAGWMSAAVAGSGALVAAWAVWEAGAIADRNVRASEARAAVQKARSLAGLYGEAEQVMLQIEEYLQTDARIGAPGAVPTDRRCKDILDALSAVPILELPGNDTATSHFAIQRAMRDALDVTEAKLAAWERFDPSAFREYALETSRAIEKLRTWLRDDHGATLALRLSAGASGARFQVKGPDAELKVGRPDPNL